MYQANIVRNVVSRIKEDLHRSKTQQITRQLSRNQLIMIFWHIFHDQSPGSNLYFRIPEETTKGVNIHVRTKIGSGLSRYQVMVNCPGVCLLESTTLRYINQGIKFSKKLIMKSLQSSSLCPCRLFCIIHLFSLSVVPCWDQRIIVVRMRLV